MQLSAKPVAPTSRADRLHRVNTVLGPVHTSNIVEATFDFVAKNGNNVEATFDTVERIVQLVAFDNVASILLLVWTGLYGLTVHISVLFNLNSSEVWDTDNEVILTKSRWNRWRETQCSAGKQEPPETPQSKHIDVKRRNKKTIKR